MNEGWLTRPITEIAKGLREGQVRPTDILNEAIFKHDQHGATLNAYRVWRPTISKEAAIRADVSFENNRDLGPLQGIPISVKDLYGVAGFDTFAGSPRPLPAAWEIEGPIVAALRRQGAVITGKTHMVEFAFGGVGTNVHWPVPRNPWDPDSHRAPGGSSSGAGVSLAEGSAVIALGSDTAGSVRIPASVTGVVGFKPSSGRWPTDGLVPLSPTFDVPGILARSVADTAVAFGAIESGFAEQNPRGLPPAADLTNLVLGRTDDHFWDDCSPGIVEQVEKALYEVSSAGGRVVPATLPGVAEAFDMFCDGGLTASEFREFLHSELPEWVDGLDPNVAARMDVGPDYRSDAYNQRRTRFIELAAAAHDAMSSVDVLISPTVPITAPPVDGIVDRAAYAKFNIGMLRNTCIANLLGLCALSVPVGLDALGMPVGLQMFAKAGDEEKLIRIGLAVEACLAPPAARLGVPSLITTA